MGRFVNPDAQVFQSALNAEIYVDKTGLIEYTNKVLGSTDAYICNSRPRRFGKSTTANMLAAYYSKGCDAKELFDGLQISQAVDYKICAGKAHCVSCGMKGAHITPYGLHTKFMSRSYSSYHNMI